MLGDRDARARQVRDRRAGVGAQRPAHERRPLAASKPSRLPRPSTVQTTPSAALTTGSGCRRRPGSASSSRRCCGRARTSSRPGWPRPRPSCRRTPWSRRCRRSRRADDRAPHGRHGLRVGDVVDARLLQVADDLRSAAGREQVGRGAEVEIELAADRVVERVWALRCPTLRTPASG